MAVNPLTLVLGLTAAASYGVADFFGARASKRMGPVASAFCVQLIGTVLYTLYYVLFVHRWPNMSWSAFGLIAVSAALSAGAVAALYNGFRIGPVSLASPLSALYPFVTAIIGLLFFHARLDGLQFAGVVILVLGVVTISGLFNVSKAEWRLGVGPRFGLLAAVLWGLSYPLLERGIDAAGWQAATIIQLIVGVIVLGVILSFRARAERFAWVYVGRSLQEPFVIAAGATQMLAGLAVNVGLRYDLAGGTLVAALSSTYPLLTMLLAFDQLKERLERRALIGAVAAVGGIVLLLV